MRFLIKKPSQTLKNLTPKKISSPVFDMLAIFGVERNSNNAANMEPAGHDEPEVTQEPKEEAPEEPMSPAPVEEINNNTIVEAVHEIIPETIKEEVLAMEKIETPQTNAAIENLPQKISIIVADDEKTPSRHIPETLIGTDDPTHHEKNLAPLVLESEIKIENTSEEYKNIYVNHPEENNSVSQATMGDVESTPIDMPAPQLEEVFIAENSLWANREIAIKNTEPVIIETPKEVEVAILIPPSIPQTFPNTPDINLITSTPSQREEILPSEIPQKIDHGSSEENITTAEETAIPVRISMEEKSPEPYASKSFYVTLS